MKKKKKNKGIKSKLYLIIGIIVVLLIGLIVLLSFKIINKKDYYKIDSRIEEVKKKGKINGDYSTAGWLKVQGTDIDMPVIYAKENLAPFPMELEEFAWITIDDAKFHNMMRIIGHNLYNLSDQPKIKSKNFHRLEELMGFVYYDFAKENKYIQYTVDGKDYVYKIFAVGFLNENQYFDPFKDYSEESMKKSIDVYKSNSIYDYKLDVKENDNLISLSTCTRFFGKNGKTNFYVVGRMIREGEKIDDYRVSKNNNYKKVEKKLKGDGNNEQDTL